MTDTMFTRTALTEAAKAAGVTTDQARTILEAAGVKVQPEKPDLPAKPGSVILATEVRGERGKWRAFLAPYGQWVTSEYVDGHVGHRPEHITAWAEVPAAAPVTLTEDQVGELWEEHRVDVTSPWRNWGVAPRMSVTRTVNAALAQYAAPAEGEPIDVADVREGDRVRLVLDNGDEGTFTVTHVGESRLGSRQSVCLKRYIRTIHLLHREEA